MESSSSSCHNMTTAQESCLEQAISLLVVQIPILLPTSTDQDPTPTQQHQQKQETTTSSSNRLESICRVHDSLLNVLAAAVDDDNGDGDATTSMNRELLQLQVPSFSTSTTTTTKDDGHQPLQSQNTKTEKDAVTVRNIQSLREYIVLQADLLRTLLVTSYCLLPKVVLLVDNQQEDQEEEEEEEEEDFTRRRPPPLKRHKTTPTTGNNSGVPSKSSSTSGQVISTHLEETIERAQLLLHILQHAYQTSSKTITSSTKKEHLHNNNDNSSELEVMDKAADDGEDDHVVGLPTNHPILEDLLSHVCLVEEEEDKEQQQNTTIPIHFDRKQLEMEEQELVQMAMTPVPQQQQQQQEQDLEQKPLQPEIDSYSSFQEQIKVLWPIETYQKRLSQSKDLLLQT